MRLGIAIERLFDNYVYASDKEWIRDKVTWALYQTWKEADNRKESGVLVQCYLRESCDHYGDKQVCGRCREYNLYSHTKTEPQTDNPCDGCVCDDGKRLMYCMNCKGVAWKIEPPKVEDKPQTGYPYDTCANEGDHDGECSNCVVDSERIRWKTPSHYKPKDEPQNNILLDAMAKAFEVEDEPQIFTWGKEVHEYCKRNCSESKARTYDGDRFIVCGQANDEICISLGKCPLGKWIAGEDFHIFPMDEPQTELWSAHEGSR